MVILTPEQRAFFAQEMARLKQTEPTYRFLSECLCATYAAHSNVMSPETFDAYVQAQQVLLKHCEYLAYRLGYAQGRSQRD